MRWRLALVALVAVALGSASASIGASASDALPAVTCSLPGVITCFSDPECAAYDAVCDMQSGTCVCAATDLGADLGSSDLAGADLGRGDAGTVAGGGGTPVSVGGGGMTGPLKKSGCSFAPGMR